MLLGGGNFSGSNWSAFSLREKLPVEQFNKKIVILMGSGSDP